MTITCHLNVIFRDAKTPRNRLDFVKCERGMKRLAEKLLTVAAFVTAVGLNQSLNLVHTFRAGKITDE